MAYLQYLEDIFKRRGWMLEEILLHQPAPIPPPTSSYTNVARAIEDFLCYRFRKPKVVAHLLHAGLFEPRNVHFASAHGEAFITRRLQGPQAPAHQSGSVCWKLERGVLNFINVCSPNRIYTIGLFSALFVQQATATDIYASTSRIMFCDLLPVYEHS
ncbi:hypothetical protein DFH06DRAFT_1340674 [Mycena polygramma]|nr:hypothetical protein DFH06DRAFT_1340674 [Mycena polygramma]